MGAGNPQTPGLERKGFLLRATVQPSVSIPIIFSSPSSHEALTTGLGDTCTSRGLSQRDPEFREPRYFHNVHGIFQARTLEWAAVSSSRGPSPPRG